MELLGVSRIASVSGLASNSVANYYDRSLWKSIGAFGLLLSMLLMLIGPLWSLPFVTGSMERLGIVTAFAMAFSILISVGTTLKSFQQMVLVAG